MPLHRIIHRNPIHARGLHCHRGDATTDQPFGHLVQVARESPALAHGIVVPVRRYRNVDLPGSDIDACRIRVDFAHPVKRMSLLNPFGTLAFLSHFFSFLDMGRPRSIKALAFSSGSFPPRRQWINQFDRRPRCTAGLRLCASPMLCTASRPAISAVYFIYTTTLGGFFREK